MTKTPKNKSISDFDPEMISSKPLTVAERKKLSVIIQQSKAKNHALKTP
jgi:hypothetical protein